MLFNNIIKNIVLIAFICLEQFCCHSNNSANSALAYNCESLKEPPFHGTIFIDSEIVTPDDISTFVRLSYDGRQERVMFDRRIANWITIQPYLFPAIYDDNI